MTFEQWYRRRFGHDFGGVADEDCDLEACWKAAQTAMHHEIMDKLLEFMRP